MRRREIPDARIHTSKTPAYLIGNGLDVEDVSSCQGGEVEGCGRVWLEISCVLGSDFWIKERLRGFLPCSPTK